ncbi:MAG: hypothetical protein LBS44_01170, partial [Deltaproteobacteria bacterium]|nr:hypothetical protein [Deltaproteobacteria bacterium]
MKEKKNNQSPARPKKRPAWRERMSRLANKIKPSRSNIALFLIMVGIAFLTVVFAHPAPDNFQVGEKADHSYISDRDMEVVDEEATVIARKKAVLEAVPLFELDYQVSIQAMDELHRIFQLGRILVNSSLTLPQDNFQDQFCHLFRLDDCPGTLKAIWEARFDNRIEYQVSQLIMEIMGQGLINEDELKGTFFGRDIEISRVWSGNSVARYSSILTVDSARNLVKTRASLLGVGQNPGFVELIVNLTMGLLSPNLKLDQTAWDIRQAESAAKVKVVHHLKAGEVIVREGDIVSPLAALKLSALVDRDSNGGLSIRPSLGLMVLLLVFLAVTQTMIHLDRKNSEIDHRELILISIILLWFVVLSWWSGNLTRGLLRGVTHIEARTMFMAMPFPTAAMLGAIFLGLRRTVYICFLGAFLGAIATRQVYTLSAFLYACNGCMVSIWGLRHISERARFIPSSLLAALVNCLTMLALTLTDGNLLSTQFLYNLLAAALSGLFSGVLASGLVTFFEFTLGLATNLKLMELGNLNRPLLRELMLAAPGTYHHSVIVGSMV